MLQATRDAIVNFIGDRTDDEAIALLEKIDNRHENLWSCES